MTAVLPPWMSWKDILESAVPLHNADSPRQEINTKRLVEQVIPDNQTSDKAINAMRGFSACPLQDIERGCFFIGLPVRPFFLF